MGSQPRLLGSNLNLSRLAETFLDLDSNDSWDIQLFLGECSAEPAGDVIRQQLGGRVGDRQDLAVLAGKTPILLFVSDNPVRSVADNRNRRVLLGQKHAVVELIHNLESQILEHDKVKHIMVLVKIVLDFDGDARVVSMEPFAHVSMIRDEMPRAEYEIVFGHLDFVGLDRVQVVFSRTGG